MAPTQGTFTQAPSPPALRGGREEKRLGTGDTTAAAAVAGARTESSSLSWQTWPGPSLRTPRAGRPTFLTTAGGGRRAEACAPPSLRRHPPPTFARHKFLGSSLARPHALLSLFPPTVRGTAVVAARPTTTRPAVARGAVTVE